MTNHTLLRLPRLLGLALATCIGAACADSPTRPSFGATVTFRVLDETFRVHIFDRSFIETARRAQFNGTTKIPVGRIVSGESVNVGWSWHLTDVSFADAVTQLCDGRPSDVEREGPSFGGGRFCPSAARVISVVER